MSNIYIGTSGFSYPHWRGNFYPQDLPQSEWFLYYTKYFDTVEINTTFYRQIKKETFINWRKIAGDNFVFALKGNRFITHIKKLKNCQKDVGRFFEAVEGDVILWQLPPGMRCDLKRLEEFLKILPQSFRQAFEFRNQTWLNLGVYKLLRKYKVAVVFQDYPDWPMTEKVTASFIYLRFHGRTGLYSSCYTKKELLVWAQKIKDWLKQGRDVYAYFNNDALGYAIENAQTLKGLCLKKN
jgi:uncharacterized protein YecE (DUF72 family)